MLLTQEVEVGVCGSEKKYYENLGYKIPVVEHIYTKKNGDITIIRTTTPRGTKIKVKVQDLPKGSNYKVKCKCDICGKITTNMWNDYIQNNHNGKTYCNKCSSMLICGEKHPNFNNNLTEEERQIKRGYKEYTDFVKKVIIRDKGKCKICGNRADVVHHLNSYDWFKEGGTDETNGISLCNNCHKSFHSKYGYGRNTRMQFKVWSNLVYINLEQYKGALPTAKVAYCIEDEEIIYNIRDYCKNNQNFTNKHSAEVNIYNSCNKKNKSHSYKEKHYVWLNEWESETINK